MKKTVFRMTVLAAMAFALGFAAYAQEPAKVAGTWEVASQGPQGPITQTLTIEQDGQKIKGTLKGQRGETAFEGTVKGNKLSWSVKRQNPQGAEMVIDYAATVDGDSMKGTTQRQGSEQPPREWTAKRQK